MNQDQSELTVGALDHSKHKKPRYERIALPYDAWPAIDRGRWERAQAANGPFDVGAPMARLADSTIAGRQKTYAALLTFLQAAGDFSEGLDPGERITPGVMLAYVNHLRQRLRASSIQEEINRLVTTLTVLAPKKDWSWLHKLPNAPARGEIERSKKPIDPPDPAVVINIALQHFDEADANLASRRHSSYARDGLLIAFAALFALRRKNLREIERGTHLLEDGSSFRLSFNGSLKNQTSLLFDIPDWIMPRFQRYLLVHRPRLLGQRPDHCQLWVSVRGTPLSAVRIAFIFADLGGRTWRVI